MARGAWVLYAAAAVVMAAAQRAPVLEAAGGEVVVHADDLVLRRARSGHADDDDDDVRLGALLTQLRAELSQATEATNTKLSEQAALISQQASTIAALNRSLQAQVGRAAGAVAFV